MHSKKGSATLKKEKPSRKKRSSGLKSFLLVMILPILFILAIPIWVLVVAPQLLKLPKDFSYKAEIISTDDFYDQEKGRYSGAQYSKTKFDCTTLESDSHKSIIENSFKVETLDGQPIFSVSRKYSIDRKTRAHIDSDGIEKREGYLFAPKGLEEGESFTYWHVNYDGPAHMEFVGREDIYGLEVFKYETKYEGIEIDQTSQLGHLPGVGSTRGVRLNPYLHLWVEPTSGRVVKYQDDTVAYYYDLKSGQEIAPWNHFSNTTSEGSVKKNVEIASKEKRKIDNIHFYLPFALFLAAVFSPFLIDPSNKILKKYFPFYKAETVSALIVIVVTSIVLVGWALSNKSLITLGLPGNRLMNPLTATLFIITTQLLLFKPLYRPVFVRFVSSLLIIIPVLNILGVYKIVPFEIDQILFSSSLAKFESHMSIFTATSFVLFGVIFILVTFNLIKASIFRRVLPYCLIFVSILIIFENLFRSLNISFLPIFLFTSLPTAIMILLTSISMIHSYPILKPRYPLSIWSRVVLLGVLFFSLLLTIAFVNTVQQDSVKEAESRFISNTDRQATLLESRLNIYINMLQGTKGLLSASETVERDEWRTYVAALSVDENYPGVQGIGYAVFIKPEDLDEHIKSIQSEGFEDYTVHPEGERDQYSAIIFIEPFNERNRQAFGFDMYQEETRRTAMELARDSGEPRMTGIITLVQEIDKKDIQNGFIIYVPFYANGSKADTIEERKDNIVGYTYAPFRANDFVNNAITQEYDDIDLKINDGANTSDETVLYDSSKDFNSPRFTRVKTLYVAGRPWTLTFESSEDYGKTTYTSYAPAAIGVLGITISILITGMIYTITSSNQRSIIYANEVTKDLKQAQAKDESILLSLGDGLVVTNKKGKIVLVNDAFCKILGWEEREVIGKELIKTVPMTDESGNLIPAEERIVTKVLRDGRAVVKTSSQSQLNYQRKDGSRFPVAITISPIILQHRFLGAVEVFRDITKDHDIDKAKTEFVSLASHQLRTPLTSIRWYTELLQEDPNLTEESLESIKEINDATHRMITLVGSLLNVSRIELGTFAVNPVPVDLIKLVKVEIAGLKPLIDSKKLNVRIVEVKLPKINVDPGLFRIVYQNILTNAVKYTPDGGSIVIRHELAHKNLTISVSDTGYGIPKKQQPFIFTKLFRADNIKSVDTQGTGLGLYIVKSIVEQSKGKIWFESVENKGTTFYIKIPASGMKKKEGSKILES